MGKKRFHITLLKLQKMKISFKEGFCDECVCDEYEVFYSGLEPVLEELLAQGKQDAQRGQTIATRPMM